MYNTNTYTYPNAYHPAIYSNEMYRSGNESQYIGSPAVTGSYPEQLPGQDERFAPLLAPFLLGGIAGAALARPWGTYPYPVYTPYPYPYPYPYPVYKYPRF